MYLYFSALIGSILGFAAGVSFSWTSPMLPKLTADSATNPLSRPATILEQSWITALISVGAILGPSIYGLTADKFGRKKTLIFLAFPMLISLVIMAFSRTVLLFLIARFIMGLGAGSVFTILPMYLVEIAEDHNRGALSTMCSVFVSLGFLFSYSIGPLLSVQNFCLVCAIPLIFFIPASIFFSPESPQFLISKNQDQQFRIVLHKLRSSKTSQEIELEVKAISKALEDLSLNTCNIQDLFKIRVLRKSLLISCGIITLQQFAGVSAVISYLQPIFESTGSGISLQLSVTLFGFVQFVIAIITSALVDTLGRKPLLLFSTVGACLSLVSLGSYFFLKNHNYDVEGLFWLPIASIIAYIIFFNFGLGPLPWTVMAELFPVSSKAKAAMITSVLCMTENFVVNFCFPSLVEFVGMGSTFWIFAGVCVVGSVGIWRFVPETRGKSIREIENILSKKL